MLWLIVGEPVVPFVSQISTVAAAIIQYTTVLQFLSSIWHTSRILWDSHGLGTPFFFEILSVNLDIAPVSLGDSQVSPPARWPAIQFFKLRPLLRMRL